MSTNDLDDWTVLVSALGAVVFFLVLAVSLPTTAANKEKTKQEAIKAGLVQDNEGHWVKPELEEKK